jgi:hypothetical protein
MEVYVFNNDEMEKARRVEGADCIRIYNEMTEVYFPNPDLAATFFDSLESDNYLLMIFDDNLNYSGDVFLNRAAGVRIKADPLTCVTFNLQAKNKSVA